MNSIARVISLISIIILIVSCERDIAICADTGGIWNKEDNKCICDIDSIGNYCNPLPVRESLVLFPDGGRVFEIHRRGSNRNIFIDGRKVKAYSSNMHENERFSFDVFVSKSEDISLVIPIRPGQFEDEMALLDCQIKLKREIKIEEMYFYLFQAKCHNLKHSTFYLVSSLSELVAIWIPKIEKYSSINFVVKYKLFLKEEYSDLVKDMDIDSVALEGKV